jgi:hypothetical protein
LNAAAALLKPRNRSLPEIVECGLKSLSKKQCRSYDAGPPELSIRIVSE